MLKKAKHADGYALVLMKEGDGFGQKFHYFLYDSFVAVVGIGYKKISVNARYEIRIDTVTLISCQITPIRKNAALY